MPQPRSPVSPPDARYFVWSPDHHTTSFHVVYHLVATPQYIASYNCGFQNPYWRSTQYSSEAESVNERICLPRQLRDGWQEISFEGFCMVMNLDSRISGIPEYIRAQFIEGGTPLPRSYPDPRRTTGMKFPFETPIPPTKHKVGVPKGKLP